jgi:Bacterial regulatory proteins, tetR family
VKLSALGPTGPERRTQLTRERVMAAAIELADRDGIESISMRKLAQELGVEAMSLYTHVRNKNDLLDGMADTVISQIPVSAESTDWKTSLRQLALGFTQALFDDSGDLEPEAAAALASALSASHPYVVEMALAVTHGGALGRCDDDAEFEFALDFILDGLARVQGG